MLTYKFHPGTDEKNHPIAEKNVCIQYRMIINDLSLSIEKAIQ